MLNGQLGGDTYQFTGNFGNDKIIERSTRNSDQDDVLQIGAQMEDVWFERTGSRDGLTITVDGQGTTPGSDASGTISIGRQYNKYTDNVW